jgi:hypothetical protein
MQAMATKWDGAKWDRAEWDGAKRDEQVHACQCEESEERSDRIGFAHDVDGKYR